MQRRARQASCERLHAGQRACPRSARASAAAGREVQSTCVGEAELRRAPRPSRRRRPPSCPARAATASATARVPAANGSSSNAPIGPFQKTVPAARDRLGVGGARCAGRCRGPSSRRARRRRRARGARRRRRSASPSTRSTGSTQLAVATPRRRSSARARELDALLLDQRVAGRVALRAEEAEAHRAADQDRVGDARGSARSRRSCRSPWRRRGPRPAGAAGRRGRAVSSRTSRSSSRPAYAGQQVRRRPRSTRGRGGRRRRRR